MRDPVERFEHFGITVSIYYDELPTSPLEWDQLAEVVAFPPLARDYNKGQLYDRELEGREWEALDRDEDGRLLARWLDFQGAEVAFFYFADHGSSGQRLWASEAEGASGFLIVPREKIIAEFGDDSATSRERVQANMNGQIKELGQYVDGDVYGIVVTDPADPEEILESIWGFFGLDYAMSEGREMAEFEAHEKAVNEEPDFETTIYRESR